MGDKMNATAPDGAWLDRLHAAFARPVERLGEVEAWLLGNAGQPAAAACAIPAAPPGIDINKNIQRGEEIRQNENILKRIDDAHAMFRNKGPYDYKQLGRGQIPNPYANFGNFDYGAMGSAMGIPDQILLRAGGWAQERAGTQRPDFGHWWGLLPYGDDPKDKKQIEAGMN